MSARGTSIFAPVELDRLVQTIVEPEIGAGHTMALVAATSASGVSAALLFRKPTNLGEWRVEAAVSHQWTGENALGAKVVWSM